VRSSFLILARSNILIGRENFVISSPTREDISERLPQVVQVNNYFEFIYNNQFFLFYYLIPIFRMNILIY